MQSHSFRPIFGATSNARPLSLMPLLSLGALVCTGCPTVDGATGLPCGDGVVESVSSEACDDGNGEDGDGCSATCEIEPGYQCAGEGSPCYSVCGDGILVETEVCDDGVDNGSAYGQCLYDCTLGPYCGDGVIDPNEECDEGALNGVREACYFDCTRSVP